jgi:hypothetical protein
MQASRVYYKETLRRAPGDGATKIEWLPKVVVKGMAPVEVKGMLRIVNDE